ncbi:MAG: hypothetical protein P4L41_12190 [Flavipsychrobacter sp.]|nr:hypothetical protein [Flavipsychrobacter sp.]
MNIAQNEISLLNKLLPYISAKQKFTFTEVAEKNGIELRFPDAYGYMNQSILDEFEPNLYNIQNIDNFLINYGYAIRVGGFLADENKISAILTLTDIGEQLQNAGSYEAYIHPLTQETNHLKRLDWILEYMSECGTHDLNLEYIWVEVKKQFRTLHIEGRESFRQQMFDKLEAEKYLVRNGGGYRITLNGIIFIADGGYQNAKKNSYVKDEQEKNYRNHTESTSVRLNLLTATLGIGTLALAVSEGMKIHKDDYTHFFQYLGSVVVIIVLIIWMMLYKRKSKKEA